MDPFIRWYDNALPPELCTEIIERFEEDERKMVGMVSGNEGGEVDLAAKQTTELLLKDDTWSDVIAALQDSLGRFLEIYTKDVKFLAGSDHRTLRGEPLRLKKYDIGGQFHWHIDSNSLHNRTRVLAAQWYFNDVRKGGHTEFEDQKMRVKPVAGRIAFFPVGWTYRHRGAPPKTEPKYVCTTFVHPVFEDPGAESQ